jgi:hypothetical protein
MSRAADKKQPLKSLFVHKSGHTALPEAPAAGALSAMRFRRFPDRSRQALFRPPRGGVSGGGAPAKGAGHFAAFKRLLFRNFSF